MLFNTANLTGYQLFLLHNEAVEKAPFKNLPPILYKIGICERESHLLYHLSELVGAERV
jgi:hypothetical protein